MDEFPDRYPAELLREWKQAQLDEHEQAQRGWPLTDADAGRALEASSRALEHHHAEAIGAIRAAERLALAARRARRGPAIQAATWHAVRARARSSFSAWDDDGNPVYAEPSRLETERCKAALLAALEAAAESLIPLADEVKVEVAAARASRPSVEPWSAWATRAVDEVVAASSAWPGPPELNDDDRLKDALIRLAEATDALTAAWRGDPASPPPLPEPDPGPPPAPRDPMKDHRALLERARPYARVDHRPYDAALRAELAAAAEQAAGIPPVPSALAIGLSARCHLAASVAANATDDELAALTEQDSHRRSLSAAVLLLAETARAAQNRGRPTPQAGAESALIALWNSVDWSDPGSWNGDDANSLSVFWEGCRITSPEHVMERLSQALAQRPDIVLPLVTACAGWAERRNHDDWRLVGIQRRYRELPSWFPGSAVIAAATSAAPNAASVAVDEFGETRGDDPESLLAQVLWLAGRATA